jgi:hypothetical protein
MATEKSLPMWMLKQLEIKTGGIYTTGLSRHPRLTRCRGCGLSTHRGLDDEWNEAIIDYDPLSDIGEAWWLLNGKKTYRLYGSMEVTRELWRRHAWSIPLWKNGDTDGAGKVIIIGEHICHLKKPPIFCAYL